MTREGNNSSREKKLEFREATYANAVSVVTLMVSWRRKKRESKDLWGAP